MDEEIERLIVSVRADTRGFARDVDEMRRTLDGPLGAGAERAGRMVEAGLLRAVRTGKLGFEELKSVALGAMADIAASAVRAGLSSLTGVGGVLGGLLSGIAPLLSGFPGRATGGPVAPGRPYLVGERGPELFVPTTAGRVAMGGGSGGADGREIRVTINVNGGAGPGDAPRMLQRSSRQVARAVRHAVMGD
ncbi:phage-related minor tail protein [Sphingomonas jejuensis]|uniref:Phage-related minor tail protein n=1 Tax=Sphingomonas jejuensis TaxID=904715 RepID=A0ABX0XIY7_9SPHN|nr:tail tape measure protein [Sphingomonas jejuensis]NJC32827.1 phage-related minor tail protein [Sphingomonas jejuensis]